jgi:hypothetical protein
LFASYGFAGGIRLNNWFTEGFDTDDLLEGRQGAARGVHGLSGMLCGKCRNENLADAVFCAECGANLELVCPSCAVANAPGSKFCRKCGARLVGDATSARSADSIASNKSVAITVLAESESLPEGERKTVTALFADIKGSTA